MPAKQHNTKNSPQYKEPDPRLLELLVCPLTKKPLVYEKSRQELISPEAGLAYPIRDGIPVMLEDQTRPLEETERARYK